MSEQQPKSAKYEFLKESYKAQITSLILDGVKPFTSDSFSIFEKNGDKDTGTAIRVMKKARLHGRDISPDVLDFYQNVIFDGFANALDPTHDRRGNGKSYKYLHWICAQFLTYRHNDKPMLIEDFPKHRDNLQDFETWSGRLHADGLPNQIDAPSLAVNGFQALPSLLRPYQQQREEKRLQNEFRRLSESDKKSIQDGTTPLYEGEEGRVLMIHNWEASKFWGTHTEWCITYKDDGGHHFHSYHNTSPVIFYLPAISARDIETRPHDHSFKFAAVDGHLWNEHDQVTTSKFPECLHKLAIAFRAHYDEMPHCQPFIDGYTHTKLIADDILKLDAPQNVTPPPHPDDIDYDDFDQVITILNSDIDHGHFHFKNSSERLKNDPDFLIAALDVERRTSNISEASSPRPRETEAFQSLLETDQAFRERALRTYGKTYSDLPRKMKEQENLALLSLEHHPIGIIEILKNVTVVNNMYEGHGVKDKRVHFFNKAMAISPSVTEFLDYVDDIDVQDIPDQTWLDTLDDHPYVLATSMNSWQNWFQQYCQKYTGDLNDPHSPRELIIKAFAEHDVHKDHLLKASPQALNTLFNKRRDILEDPEIAVLNSLYADCDYNSDVDNIMMAAFKKSIKKFEKFNDEQRSDPRIMREILRHVIDTDQKALFAKHLRYLPFSSTKHPETLMSCEAVLAVIDRAFPDLEPWPNFQDRIDQFRASPPSATATATTRPKRGMTP